MMQRDQVSDRIRPFLKAMERSIERARSERLSETSQAPGVQNDRPARTSADQMIGTNPVREESQTPGTSNGPRLKARPKRPVHFG